MKQILRWIICIVPAIVIGLSVNANHFEIFVIYFLLLILTKVETLGNE